MISMYLYCCILPTHIYHITLVIKYVKCRSMHSSKKLLTPPLSVLFLKGARAQKIGLKSTYLKI